MMLNQENPKIKKDYLTLCEVAKVCGVPLEDLRYLGEEGKIKICLRRIPVNVAIENFLNKKPYTDNPTRQRELRQIMTEPQPLHQTDIYRIFSNRDERVKITRKIAFSLSLKKYGEEKQKGLLGIVQQVAGAL